MTATPTVERLTAFSELPSGGNPAGVWIGPELPPAAEMQALASAVGYSETAFATPAGADGHTVRYFSPVAEVPFCGHATIALGVALGSRHGAGRYLLQTQAGEVPVRVDKEGGRWVAALTSVPPRQAAVRPAVLAEALEALGWHPDELDPAIPPIEAYAGAAHLVLAARTRATLADLDYDFDRLARLMQEVGWTTLQLVWREHRTRFHARNPFPVGGVVEDPATGAAAAALGGYLRAAGLIAPPAEIEILQGADMGRPGLLRVSIPSEGGIVVRGTATWLDD